MWITYLIILTTMTYTKEDKKEYFRKLRLEWKKSKALAENDMVAEALYREAGIQGMSYFSFYYVLIQMRALKLKGIPYVNAKTYNGWKENAFTVKKGEKALLSGIVWKEFLIDKDGDKDDDGNKRLYPKVYKLFHDTQVEEIKK